MSVAASARRAVLAGVRGAAVLKDRVRPPRPGVTVLIYHRVGARTPMSVDLPTGAFADQVARVATRAVTLDAALEVLAGPAPAPDAGPRVEPPVVVTFDDGTADVLEVALPILVEHRVPMLLYLATQFVDEGLPFPHDGRPASWAALADGLTTGYLEIGSHTHRHALLDRIAPGEVDDELDRSIELIRDRLGVDPVHFAYPKALPPNAVADAAVRRRFRSAALAGTAANAFGATDPWALARTPVQARDDDATFERKLAGGLGLEDDLRRLAARIRHRGASS